VFLNSARRYTDAHIFMTVNQKAHRTSTISMFYKHEVQAVVVGDGSKQWVAASDFMRRASAVASYSRTLVVDAKHTVFNANPFDMISEDGSLYVMRDTSDIHGYNSGESGEGTRQTCTLAQDPTMKK
jgi:hypothetical protein